MPEMIKKAIFLLLGVLAATLAFCQNTKGLQPRVSKNTKSGIKRAVVVGVSDYQNENIPDLQYAHIDAKLFAEYLQSSSGDHVKKENIKLLINEEATAGQFINALYWLLEQSKEGDEAVIYFSGHGDVESSIMNQPGFLLCWDAPAKVYMGGGTFGLNYLKDIIATLTSQNNAKITVITDACRSGNLAGNESGGAQATATYLAQQFAQEIKIMSCQPNEFALEGASWGNGRGVFSYYLLLGLKGAADQNGDDQISLKEIQRYLEDNVSEQVLPHQQNPLTVGNRNARIAKVDPEVKKRLKTHLKEFGEVDYRALNMVTPDTSIEKILNRYKKAIDDNRLLYPEDSSAYSILKELEAFDNFSQQLGIYKRNLAALLQDEAQQSINAYLAADTKEILQRWKFDESYYVYPTYLEKAAELIGQNHFFYPTLRARAYYFKGLKMRLLGEQNFDTSLVESSISLQDSSLLIDSLAAHALNEKGYIYHLLKKDSLALSFYNRAASLSPRWPLVYTNMSLSYLMTGDYDKAISSSKKALSIDSTFLLGHLNLSTCYKKLGESENQLLCLNQAYEIDSNFYPTLDELGSLAYDQNKFELAEKYWLSSYKINPNTVFINNNLGYLYLHLNNAERSKIYFENIRKTRPQAIESYQGMIEYHFYNDDLKAAQKELQLYLQKYPDDEYAYYLLSSIAASFSDQTAAIEYLKTAFQKGFNQFDVLEQDANFKEIKNESNFKILISQYK